MIIECIKTFYCFCVLHYDFQLILGRGFISEEDLYGEILNLKVQSFTIH